MNEYRVNEEELLMAETKPVCDMPLSALMDAACNKAFDALQMAHKINHHLFGIGKNGEKSVNPSCFKEALQNCDCTLLMLCEELARIAERLGV